MKLCSKQTPQKEAESVEEGLEVTLENKKLRRRQLGRLRTTTIFKIHRKRVNTPRREFG